MTPVPPESFGVREAEASWNECLGDFGSAFPPVWEHFERLCKFNEKCNLFSRKMTREMAWYSLILDSAIALPHFPKKGHFLDFGTGGGLPGAVLAICLPKTRWILCDKSPKKIKTVSDLIGAGGIRNAKALVGLNSIDPQRFFDIVTIRAVGTISSLVPLLRDHSSTAKATLCFYKARLEGVREELCPDEIFKQAQTLKLDLPVFPDGERRERHLVKIPFAGEGRG